MLLGKYIHTVRTFAVGRWLMATQKGHQPLKCAHKDRITVGWGRGTSYPEVGYKSKENKTTITEAKRMGRETAGKPGGHDFCSGIFVDEQRLGRRCTAADRIHPHRMVHHHRVLWVGIAVC